MEPQAKEFIRWLFGHTKKYKYIVAMIASLSIGSGYLVSFTTWIGEFEDLQRAGIFALIQAVILVVLIVVPIKTNRFSEERPNDDDERKIMKLCGCTKLADWDTVQKNANRAQDQFIAIWRAILTIWLVLYVCLTFQYFFLAGHDGNTATDGFRAFILVGGTFNNISTVLLIGWFIVLAKVTTDGAPNSSIPIQLGVIVVILFIAHFGIYSVHEAGFSFGEKTRYLSQTSWMKVPSWLGGVLSGMAFALVIGRLDSKYINAPTAILVLLYLYAAIQPLFIVFSDKESTQAGIYLINAALFFKLLLFMFLSWAIEEGRLLFYFARIRRLHMTVEEEIEQFSNLELTR